MNLGDTVKMKDKGQTAKWVAAWDRAGSNLSAIKKKELQNEDYYFKNREILNDMLQYAAEHRTNRKSSGLVEQQRLFKLLHLKNRVSGR